MLDDLPTFTRSLLAWYQRSHRKLPWRMVESAGRPDAYHVLVSELMLQQTQVATVIPYFHRFIERFPDFQALAEASEQDVLRLWQGLGYYSRARNLQRAAQKIVGELGGNVPKTPDALRDLPGVGRYTAGAIASIALGIRAPILDGNVIRVLCRLDAETGDPRDRKVLTRLWQRAEEILPRAHFGDFNSALMELGATICTPRNPQCLVCPVRNHCGAVAAGIQDQIPPAKKAIKTPLERRIVLCVRRGDRWLIEQRPPTGRWAGMWQFITRPKVGRSSQTDDTSEWPVPIGKTTKLGVVRHALTHRRYVFEAYFCDAKDQSSPRINHQHAWVRLDELSTYPFSKPQLTIAGFLNSTEIQTS